MAQVPRQAPPPPTLPNMGFGASSVGAEEPSPRLWPVTPLGIPNTPLPLPPLPECILAPALAGPYADFTDNSFAGPFRAAEPPMQGLVGSSSAAAAGFGGQQQQCDPLLSMNIPGLPPLPDCIFSPALSAAELAGGGVFGAGATACAEAAQWQPVPAYEAVPSVQDTEGVSMAPPASGAAVSAARGPSTSSADVPAAGASAKTKDPRLEAALAPETWIQEHDRRDRRTFFHTGGKVYSYRNADRVPHGCEEIVPEGEVVRLLTEDVHFGNPRVRVMQGDPAPMPTMLKWKADDFEEHLLDCSQVSFGDYRVWCAVGIPSNRLLYAMKRSSVKEFNAICVPSAPVNPDEEIDLTYGASIQGIQLVP